MGKFNFETLARKYGIALQEKLLKVSRVPSVLYLTIGYPYKTDDFKWTCEIHVDISIVGNFFEEKCIEETGRTPLAALNKAHRELTKLITKAKKKNARFRKSS